ncbi:hypothetical protein [Shuttleworthella sp. MSX8B]|uniref:hypothetical protein n=1 Tax=Shuttleworthella sp. MSX8B TaxID=936574 RepID=UPI0004B1283C|nr:hypothetical protein [Shuttleworthia sp. MSX8B]
MAGLLLVVLLMVVLFKATGFAFRIAGKILGGIISIAGYLILAGIAVTVFGIAMVVLPVILIIGGAALISTAAS